MKKRLKVLCILLILIPCLPLFAADVGLLLDQTVGVNGSGGTNNFDYTGAVIPWLSAFFTENSEFYLSAGFNADYTAETWTLVPELLRTEVSGRFSNGTYNLGRMQYSDPLGLIASGLFDGGRLSFHTTGGIISVGAWYTGLLYKNRANIAMTDSDLELVGTEVDLSNFVDTYFAPSRAIAALGWEHPSLGGRVKANLTALAQFDMTEDDFHTQYLIGKITVPGSRLIFDLGGSLGLKHEDGDVKTTLLGEIALSWLLPTSIDDRLMLLGRTATGSTEFMSTFIPITTVSQGSILRTKISGISLFSLNYSARLSQAFALDLSSTYFMRNDFATFYSYPVLDVENENYFLGNEFFAWVLWSPVSDLRFNAGAGIFLPSMGDVAPDANSLWRLELNAILSLY